jgi:hypothetical protein
VDPRIDVAPRWLSPLPEPIDVQALASAQQRMTDHDTAVETDAGPDFIRRDLGNETLLNRELAGYKRRGDVNRLAEAGVRDST